MALAPFLSKKTGTGHYESSRPAEKSKESGLKGFAISVAMANRSTVAITAADKPGFEFTARGCQ